MNRKQRRATASGAQPGSGQGAGGASPVAGWFSAALAHQRAGRLADAERLCRQLLAIAPGHAQTLHLLGLVAHNQGRSDQAVEHIRTAIAREPRDPAFHHNLGNILAANARPVEALAAFERAVALAPGSVDTLYNLGNICHELGQTERAIGWFERALRLRPDAVELHNNLGLALQDVGRLDEAIACYRRVLTLRPDTLEALDNLAGALRTQGALDEARATYERALALDRDRVESHIGLGATLRDGGSLDDAARHCLRALELAPDHPAAHNNLGVALVGLGRPAEAVAHYSAALVLQPDRAEIHNNLGIAREQQRQYGAALECYGRALLLNPDYAEAHFNRAHALLLTGQLDEGWREYEWRFAVARYDRGFARPLWSGEPLAGRTILVHAEQGFGDTLQFARYLPAVASHGGRVLLEIPRPLVGLVSSVAGVTQVIAAGDRLPEFECHCPLLSLPRVLGTNISTIPRDVPYLSAPPARIEPWRRLLPERGLRVGIAWQGNPNASADKARSLALRAFAPLAAVPDVNLVSLQKYDGVEQLDSLPAGMRVVDLGPDFDRGPDAFLDTAAIMMSLDVIISCDTSVAHLAGALARPVWIVLPYNPDWRWLTDRDDSPWYPTARLFRQSRLDDWQSVIGEIADALNNLSR